MCHVCANTARLRASAAVGLDGRLAGVWQQQPQIFLEETGLQSRPTTDGHTVRPPGLRTCTHCLTPHTCAHASTRGSAALCSWALLGAHGRCSVRRVLCACVRAPASAARRRALQKEHPRPSTLPDLDLVLLPLGSAACRLSVYCLGSQNFPFGVPKLAPRADLTACSDRTKAQQQQQRERPRSLAYKSSGYLLLNRPASLLLSATTSVRCLRCTKEIKLLLGSCFAFDSASSLSTKANAPTSLHLPLDNPKPFQ
jgi:hypothetical protein